MRNFFRGGQKHLIVLGLAIVYVLVANQLYIQFFLKDGKPLGANIQLPSIPQNIVFKLSDLIQPIHVNGQDLYEIKGYAFFAANHGQMNTIQIVLTSAKGNIVFPTHTVPVPDMIRSLPNYTSSMDHAEFSFLVSKNVLKPGTYQIGILLQPGSGMDPSYIPTGGSLQVTPNTLKYLPVK